MKNNWLSYLFLILLAMSACDSITGQANGAADEATETAENSSDAGKNISSVDLSITPQTAYSNLFLDSSALKTFLSSEGIDDSTARRMQSFYNSRNFQYAWFSDDGPTQQALGFWNLHQYNNKYGGDSSAGNKELNKIMNRIVGEEELSLQASDKNIQKAELLLTQHFIQYMRSEYAGGYVKRKEMENFVPTKKRDVAEVADSLLNKKHKDDKYFEDKNARYGALKAQLGKYLALAKSTDSGSIKLTGKSFKKGQSSPSILAIKRRLQALGDLSGGDSTAVFNDSLEMAVRNFQARHGYKEDGVIGASVIKELNVSPRKRLEQLMINMERMRWMPNEPKSDNLIVVNIPEFVLHMYEGDKKVWDMDVVVGKVGHNTMMFTGDLNQVVFSPYWNVPESIVEKEILPAMRKNPNYLSAQNMEQVGGSGDMPTIRQKPGPKNSLGKVKFLFPNSFNIYFHDTPAKGLFAQEKRAFSHGCIRLSDPTKMAEYLLRNDPSWTPERIDSSMNAGKEKYVKVNKPVPVLITYYTAWVDEQGRLNFRDDVYSHDAQLATKMFINPSYKAPAAKAPTDSAAKQAAP